MPPRSGRGRLWRRKRGRRSGWPRDRDRPRDLRSPAPRASPSSAFPSLPRVWTSGGTLAEACDLLIHDSQYSTHEYADHVGWGHSSLSSVVSLGLDANVGKLLLFHHDPNHDDEMIDQMVEHARALVKRSGRSLEVEAAREGAEILLGAKTPAS